MAEADAESALINGIQSEQKRTQMKEKKQSGIFAELLKTTAKKSEVTKEVKKENKPSNPFAGLGSALLQQKRKLKKTGED